jgi:hypothetical protein
MDRVVAPRNLLGVQTGDASRRRNSAQKPSGSAGDPQPNELVGRHGFALLGCGTMFSVTAAEGLPNAPVSGGARSRPEPSLDNYALAYAQRRVWVFGSWWYGAMIAASGAVHALAAVLMGSDAEIGAVLAPLGVALAGLGWIVSAPKRFTRKPPKPAMDVNRAEQAIRIDAVS